MSQGIISNAQLQQALERQRVEGGHRVGEILMESAGVSEAHIARALGVQWNSPVLTLEGFSPEAMARVAPPVLLERTGMVPVRLAGGRALYLGFETELNPSVALALEKTTGLQVHSGFLPSSKLRSARQRIYDALSVPVMERNVHDQDGLLGDMCSTIEKQQPVAARLTRIGNVYWMRLWLEEHDDDMLDCVWSLGF